MQKKQKRCANCTSPCTKTVLQTVLFCFFVTKFIFFVDIGELFMYNIKYIIIRAYVRTYARARIARASPAALPDVNCFCRVGCENFEKREINL